MKAISPHPPPKMAKGKSPRSRIQLEQGTWMDTRPAAGQPARAFLQALPRAGQPR